MNDEMFWKMKLMGKKTTTSILMSIAFSVFGTLLIFGLGFVFPTVNPYVVIKWIIIVCAVSFVIAFLEFIAYKIFAMKMMKGFKSEAKLEVKVAKTKKSSKKK